MPRKISMTTEQIISELRSAYRSEITSAEVRAFCAQKGLNYQTCNDVMGALEGAKAEFYRRVVGPYEDQKIEENGDVYYF